MNLRKMCSYPNPLIYDTFLDKLDEVQAQLRSAKSLITVKYFRHIRFSCTRQSMKNMSQSISSGARTNYNTICYEKTYSDKIKY